MNSRFFAFIDAKENEDFRTDCGALHTLIQNDPSKLLEAFQAVDASRLAKTQQDVSIKYAATFNVSPPVLFQSLRVLKALSTAFLDEKFKNDTPETLAADFIAFCGAAAPLQADVLALLRRLQNHVVEGRAQIRGREFESAVIPTLHEFSGAVDIRPVFNRGELSSDHEYSAEMVAIVPAIVLRIETSATSNDNLVFQLREEQLDQMMNQLANLKKELGKAKVNLKLQG